MRYEGGSFVICHPFNFCLVSNRRLARRAAVNGVSPVRELDAGRAVLATMARRLRRNRIKIMNGDKVSLELSPYNLTKGRITYRHK